MDSNGFIMEVLGEWLFEEFKFCWVFGVCDGVDDFVVIDNSILVVFCFYNVFSIEGNVFIIYYGESMKLRMVYGVFFIGFEICLFDGYK